MLVAVWRPEQQHTLTAALTAFAHSLPPSQPWALDLRTLRRTSAPARALYFLRSSLPATYPRQVTLLIRSIDNKNQQRPSPDEDVFAICHDKPLDEALFHHLTSPAGPWHARQSPLHLTGFQTTISDFEVGIGALYIQSHSQPAPLGILITISWKPRPNLDGSSQLLQDFLVSILPPSLLHRESSVQILQSPYPLKDPKYTLMHTLVHYLGSQGLA